MPKYIFENSPVTLTARARGRLKKYTATFKVTDDAGKDIKTEDAPIQQGKAELNFDAPKVEAGKQNYLLKYTVTVDGEEHPGSEEFKVWIRNIKISAVDDEGNGVAQVPFDINYGVGRPMIVTTGIKGNLAYILKKPGVFGMGVKPPYEIVQQLDPKGGREFKFEVERKFLAEIINPTPPDDNAAIEQMVNMPSTNRGHDKKGSEIEFEVGVKGENQGERGGKTGDEILIRVTYVLNSDRNDPLPELKDATDITSEEDGDTKIYKGKVTLTADQSTAKFKTELGLTGGDTCEVSVGGTERREDHRIRFENWRKLAYQLRFPDFMKTELKERTRKDTTKYHDMPDAIRNLADTRLGEARIAYENIESKKFADPAVDTPIMSTDGFIKLNGDAAKTVFILNSNWEANIGTAFTAAADNRENHITLCHAAYSTRSTLKNPWFVLRQQEKDNLVIDLEHAKKGYLFPKYSPAHQNQINIDVAGLTWRARMDLVSDANKLHKPTLEPLDVSEPGGAVDGEYTVSEVNQGLPEIDVTFTGDNLEADQIDKINDYVQDAFDDDDDLRVSENKINFEIEGKNTTVGDRARVQKIKDAINAKYNGIDKKILFHPGVDLIGDRKSGPMSDITITHKDMYRIKVTLPVRADPDDDPLPGDLAGNESADKCPIQIEFKMQDTYSINGNSGGGEQLLVLKTASPGPNASTICHELGHSMGMTSMPNPNTTPARPAPPTPPGLTAPKHVDNGGLYYVNKKTPLSAGQRDRHAGGHCSFGMPGNKRSKKPDFEKWSAGPNDNVCIMWGEGGSHDNRKHYCPICLKYLKARRLEDIRSRWDNRAADQG